MRKYSSPLFRQQVEKLQELGQYLQQQRQEQALSLEDLAMRTRIPLRALQAIEEGKLEQLPEPVYVRGFIRKFADALGLRGTEIADDFPTELTNRSPGGTWKELPAAQLRPIHLYLLYILVIVCAVNGLSALMRRSARAPGSLPAITEAIPAEPDPAAVSPKNTTDTTTSQEQPTSSPPQPQSPIQVSLTFRAQSWIRVVVDSKTAFEGILPEGTQRSWKADERLTIRAGNAGGILLALNNGTAKPMGVSGAVEEVVFEADEVTASASVPNAAGRAATNQ